MSVSLNVPVSGLYTGRPPLTLRTFENLMKTHT